MAMNDRTASGAARLGAKRPVIILTGFLGSGKTTLLRHLLSSAEMANTAVIVNEFGEVGLDHHLLRNVEENREAYLLESGCLCCAMRPDLVQTLLDLLDMEQRGRIPRLERVVIETSGLADPAPIAFTVASDPVLQHHFRVEGVATTVDAANAELHLSRHVESVKQVCVADRIIITKADLVTDEQLASLRRRLRQFNPEAEVVQAVFGRVRPDQLLRFGNRYQLRLDAAPFSESPSAGTHNHHSDNIRSGVLVWPGITDWLLFAVWLSMLLQARGEDVLRLKGLVDVGAQGPVVINTVQHIVHPPEHLDAWPSDDRRSRIVFITRGIEPDTVVASFEAFLEALGDIRAEKNGWG